MEDRCKILIENKFPSEACYGCPYYDNSVDGEEVCMKGLYENKEVEK